MRRSWSMPLVVAAIWLRIFADASAQPIFAHVESVECVVHNAEVVAVGSIVDVAGDEQTPRAAIAVAETLKGAHRDRMRLRIDQPPAVLKAWQAQSRSLLLTTQDGESAASVIDLGSEDLAVLTADLVLLRNPDDVVRCAREAIRRAPGVTRRSTFGLMVPLETVAGTKWSKYHGVLLIVPVDESLERLARKHVLSKDYLQRREGAEALRFFRSDENIARARALLEDPGYSHLHRAEDNQGLEVRIYGVRQAAYETLEHWGIATEKPLVREEIRHEPGVAERPAATDARPSAEVVQRVNSECGFSVDARRKGKRDLVVLEDYQTIFDDDLVALRELTDVTDIHLMGYFTERGLAHLGGLKNIELVRLEFAVDVTDRVLAVLGTLPNLRELYISQAADPPELAAPEHRRDPRITDRGLAAFGALRRLEVLELHNVDLTNEGLRHLAKFPTLRKLSIASPNLTEAGLSKMPKLKKLGEPKFEAHRIVAEPASPSAPAAAVPEPAEECAGKEGRKTSEADAVERQAKARAFLSEIGASIGQDPAGEINQVLIDCTFGLWDEPEAWPKEKLLPDLARHLRALPHLKSVSITDWVYEEGDLKYLAEVPHLTGFATGHVSGPGLSNLRTPSLTGAGLKHLTQTESLRAMSLASPALADEALRQIARFTNLRSLQIHGADKITPKGWKHLRALDLEVLSLPVCRLLDDDLAHVAHMRSLRRLVLYQNEMGDGGLKHLAKLRRLEELELHTNRITDAGLAHLARLTALRDLNLDHNGITGEGTRHLADLRRLELLRLSRNTELSDAALPPLEKLRALKFVGLNETKVSIDGVRRYHARRPQVQLGFIAHRAFGLADHWWLVLDDALHVRAVLFKKRAGDDDLARLARDAEFADVQSVSLSLAYAFSNQGLAQLLTLEKLKGLHLDRCEIGDEGLEIVGRMSKLERLNIERTGISGGGLRHIGGLTELKWLDASHNGLADQDLAHLGRLTKLEELDVGGNPITNAGLEHLERLPKLRYVLLNSTQVSLDGLRKLKRVNQAHIVHSFVEDP